jgi:hypothetical protein
MNPLKQFRRCAVGIVLTISVPAIAQQAADPDYIPANLEAIEQSFDTCLTEHDRAATEIMRSGDPDEIEKLVTISHWAEISSLAKPI